jgi:hypothetical protein
MELIIKQLAISIKLYFFPKYKNYPPKSRFKFEIN